MVAEGPFQIFCEEIQWSYIVNAMTAGDLGPLLLTWIDFNPGMDK